MNQVLKYRVYTLGTQREVDFVKEQSGMSELEQKVFQLLHEYKDDGFIRDALLLDRKTYDRVEDSIRVKLAHLVLGCIDTVMAQNKDKS